MMSTLTRSLLLLFALLLFLLRECCYSAAAAAAVAAGSCTSNVECEDKVGKGSKCRSNGICSNPFSSGCLHQRLLSSGKKKKKRVCNSDDTPNAAELGLCRVGDFDYMEVRIASQNWESVFFQAYLLQILLSELLDVPATIETGTPDARLNFYHPDMPFEYGITNDYDGLERAALIRDCRSASRNPDNYESCAHVLPEDWEAHNNWVKDRVQNGLLEPPQGLAVVGQESWFIPQFSLRREPSLSTYLGMQGEENRRKLADFFRRPTKWGDYCEFVSPNGCRIPDRVALRGPRNKLERGAYYAPNLFRGHFRKTEQNDCDKNPTTCTGHIVDYPCGWSSYVQQITNHLDIALESNGDEPGSGGYTYSEMVQIIHAANATQSNVIVQWWTPETLYSELLGTDAELQRVALPPTTQTCVESRVDVNDRCSNNATLRTGSPLGVCDEAAHPLDKILSKGLYDAVHDPSISAGSQSPAYDAIQRWSINNLQIGEIFEYWNARQLSSSSRGRVSLGLSAREAVCDWAVDNMAFLEEFVPRSYPRVLHEKNFTTLHYVAIAVAGIAFVATFWAGCMVFRRRKRRIIRVAQIEFLWLVLAGLLILAMGALLGMFATDGTCVAAMWFINFGYTLELVPLIVKVAAINRLMTAADSMRRVVLRRKSLFGAVAVINGFVLILLVLWNVLDSPVKTPEYNLSNTVTDKGDTVVTLSFYCSSKSNIWRYALVSVNAILLLWATVLAFQSRHLRQEFNESITLAIMIYSHAVFLVLRLITFFLEGSVSSSILQPSQSLIFGVDTVMTVIIYFVPKVAMTDQMRRDSMRRVNLYLRRLRVTRNLASSTEESQLNFPVPPRNIVEKPRRNHVVGDITADVKGIVEEDGETRDGVLEVQDCVPRAQTLPNSSSSQSEEYSAADDWTSDDERKESDQGTASENTLHGVDRLDMLHSGRDTMAPQLDLQHTTIASSALGEETTCSASLVILQVELQEKEDELRAKSIELEGTKVELKEKEGELQRRVEELRRKDEELDRLRSELVVRKRKNRTTTTEEPFITLEEEEGGVHF